MCLERRSSPGEKRRHCGCCDYSWLDKYGKNECPKCLAPLVGGGGVAPPKTGNVIATGRRLPGEAVTYKLAASDACESVSGQCGRGGAHTWKFGKCSKCGLGEGYGKGRTMTGMKDGICCDGRMHVYKFSKCTKCGKMEF
eukprot:357348-Chlamydomonas_euryale.AAC.1